MNQKLKLMVVTGAALLSLWGCSLKKEEAPVVTEQPVLGVDVSGYEGFSHLSAYTLEGENPSVLYLPANENAYVGGTCIISQKEGVEVTLNLNPLLSDEVTGKPLKEKLKYMLDSEYSSTYRQDYMDLEISDIEALENGGARAEVSYLVYNDDKKGYTGQWLEYYLVELEDGRFFEVALRVDSDLETDMAGAVVEELEKYFETDFAYESGILQAKIDGYDPDEGELAKMNGQTIPFGEFILYLPQGFSKNTVYSSMMPGGTVYGKNGNSMEEKLLLCTLVQEIEGNGAELGALTKGEQKVVEQIFREMLEEQYPGMQIEMEILGMTDMGFVFTAYIEDLTDDGTTMYLYYICRGNTVYAVGGFLVDSNDGFEELIELVDSIYATMEVR